VTKIITNDSFLFLRQNPTTSSHFSHQKRIEKIIKVKFGTKIKFLKITWTSYLIAQKDGGLK
jgi:hypothetical protein